jgi:hypothetical protein
VVRGDGFDIHLSEIMKAALASARARRFVLEKCNTPAVGATERVLGYCWSAFKGSVYIEGRETARLFGEEHETAKVAERQEKLLA